MSLKSYMKVLGAFAAVFAFSVVATASALAANDAPRFTVSGKTPIASESFKILKGTSTGSENAAHEKAKEPGKLEVPGLFTLENPKDNCTVAGSITGSAVDKPGTATVFLSCTGVTVQGLPHCLLHSPGQPNGTVITEPLVGTLVWLTETGDKEFEREIEPGKKTKTQAIGLTFKSETARFVTIQVTDDGTGTCPVALNADVTGCTIGEVESVTTDAVEQSINFPTTPITQAYNNDTPDRTKQAACELKVLNKPAAFTNTFDIQIEEKGKPNPAWGVEPG